MEKDKRDFNRDNNASGPQTFNLEIGLDSSRVQCTMCAERTVAKDTRSREQGEWRGNRLGKLRCKESEGPVQVCSSVFQSGYTLQVFIIPG